MSLALNRVLLLGAVPALVMVIGCSSGATVRPSAAGPDRVEATASLRSASASRVDALNGLCESLLSQPWETTGLRPQGKPGSIGCWSVFTCPDEDTCQINLKVVAVGELNSATQKAASCTLSGVPDLIDPFVKGEPPAIRTKSIEWTVGSSGPSGYIVRLTGIVLKEGPRVIRDLNPQYPEDHEDLGKETPNSKIKKVVKKDGAGEPDTPGTPNKPDKAIKGLMMYDIQLEVSPGNGEWFSCPERGPGVVSRG